MTNQNKWKRCRSQAAGAVQAEGVVDREAGLHRSLTSRQVAMIGLGCTIGTGLFLGSAISVKLAGPAVLVSFLVGALITLTVMWALAEMAAEHPAAGSLGLYAEMYVHPWAGFAIRYTYWLCLVFVIGSEVVAASIYCKYWLPGFAVVGVDRWIFAGVAVCEYHQHQKLRQFRILVRDDQGGDHRGVF